MDYLKGTQTDILCPEFWKTHQQYRLWEVTDGKSYYNAALDYSFAEVRRRKTDTVREVAENYDVDGIEPAHNYVYRLTPETDAALQRAMAANYLAQGADGIYMFNYPCALFQDPCVTFNGPAFKTLTSVLSEMGSLKTLRNRNKKYTYFPGLPIWVEANRPPQYHQTIRFKVFGNDLASAATTIRFRQIAERNPHAEGTFRQNPIVSPGFLKYYVNGEEIQAQSIKRNKQRGRFRRALNSRHMNKSRSPCPVQRSRGVKTPSPLPSTTSLELATPTFIFTSWRWRPDFRA